MSIVISTKDKFQKQRDATRTQELHIEKEDAYAKWRLPSVDRFKPIMKVLGIAALPVVAFWGLLLVGIGFAMTIVVSLLKTLGKLFR